GFRPVSQVGARHSSGIAPLFNQRNETRLGVRVAFINGCGNLRDDPDRLWSRPSSSLRPRTKRNGPSDRHHARDCCDRLIGGQNFVFALGTFSPPALGNGQSLKEVVTAQSAE